MTFDGRIIRDQILEELTEQVSRMKRRPALAVFLVGSDPVSVAYVALKRKIAEEIGLDFVLKKYDESVSQAELITKIDKCNRSQDIDGIMVQIPLPAQFNRSEIIAAISANKDVDGLRYCQGLESKFSPPVVLAILKALDEAKIDLDAATVAVIGQGFLVGRPISRYLEGRVNDLILIDSTTTDLGAVAKDADVVISAAGSANLVKPNMIKDGVVLVDAGTSEVGGQIQGDIDPACYPRASFYTPVPGGVGPVTVALLFANVVRAAA